MTDILVTENITGDAMDCLCGDFQVTIDPQLWQDTGRLVSAVASCRGLIVRNQTQVTAQLLAAAPNLQIVARAGAGLDNVDTAAASDAGIVVTYAPHENSVSVAELTIGLVLALARKIPAADRDTRQGGWDRRQFTGFELQGKALGVVGLGRIGMLVARRAKALGMSILGHDQYRDPKAPELQELAVRLVDLEALLEQADVVTCHVPLTDETRGMFAGPRFARMKPTALFVNTSRGEVVVEQDLVAALVSHQIAGAALDVREVEPPPSGQLSTIQNVILTPHVAAFTHEAQQRVVAAVCNDVADVLRGGQAKNYANFPQPRRSN